MLHRGYKNKLLLWVERVAVHSESRAKHTVWAKRNTVEW